MAWAGGKAAALAGGGAHEGAAPAAMGPARLWAVWLVDWPGLLPPAAPALPAAPLSVRGQGTGGWAEVKCRKGGSRAIASTCTT